MEAGRIPLAAIEGRVLVGVLADVLQPLEDGAVALTGRLIRISRSSGQSGIRISDCAHTEGWAGRLT
jgi:hypothetical protein